MKHTPTPWICHSGMVWKPDGSEDGIPIAHMDREYGNGTVPTERDANAHHIVKCVNSHDVLVDICQHIFESVHEGDAVLEDNEQLLGLKQALFLAKGKNAIT